jgi:hypothetical protein
MFEVIINLWINIKAGHVISVKVVYFHTACSVYSKSADRCEYVGVVLYLLFNIEYKLGKQSLKHFLQII